jgi:SPP1 gp7 family putative phage head morphogenesis protein
MKIKSPQVLKTTEREFREALAGMVILMSRIYRKQVLEGLHQSTVAKFADAQAGNFSSVFLGLAKSVTRKLKSRFNDKRIKHVVEVYFKTTDKRAKGQLYDQISKASGFSSAQLAAEEGLKPFANALILETTQWAKKLRDETLELYTSNTMRVMTLGANLETIMSEFDAMTEKRKNHAEFTARNQIGNFNSIMTKTRAQNLGIKQAVWETSDDERVRESHVSRQGKVFNLDEGLYDAGDGESIFPGAGSYNCRCSFSFVLDYDE